MLNSLASGVLSVTGCDVASEAEPRVTFLVNIWLHHVPSGVTPLPDDITAALHTEETVDQPMFVNVVEREEAIGVVPITSTKNKGTNATPLQQLQSYLSYH
jgi:hypothetical protein